MRSSEDKKKGKDPKEKTTWGNVEPGKRTADEESALGPAEANAKHKDSDNVSSPNMDPEPNKGEEQEEGRTEDWQQLSRDEKKRSEERKGGYPKN